MPKSQGETEKAPIDSKAAPPARVVEATHYRGGKLMGPIAIIGSTKHGTTTLLSVKDAHLVRDGDVLKTKAWLLNAREFSVLRSHEKPMKIPGFWYEVKPVAAPAPKRK